MGKKWRVEERERRKYFSELDLTSRRPQQTAKYYREFKLTVLSSRLQFRLVIQRPLSHSLS